MLRIIKSKRLWLTCVLALFTASTLMPTFPAAGRGAEILPPAPAMRPHQQTTPTNNLYLPLLHRASPTSAPADGWPMVAANPERTSWAAQGISGFLHVEWYLPIEAYIPQNVQIIGAYGLLYISTAGGLYALNATTGEVAWRYDTELPLGNSPTIHNGVAYVGGFDRKLHAVDAYTGARLWTFDSALAGYDTNPLVIDNKVIIANRDGALYAIGAHRSALQGQLIWKFQTGGPIHLSPAYKDGRVFFASNDNYAYAVDISSGSMLWRSAKLPSDGFHTWWPVIYRDKVIFAASQSYRTGRDPGTTSLTDQNNNVYGQYYYMDRDDVFSAAANGTLLGGQINNPGWGNGFTVLNASRITEYLENNPSYHQYKHKPWRRMLLVLNQSNGTEYTYDSDRDGYPEYIPVVNWGGQSGNRYPPIIGPDGLLYVSNIYQKFSISQGRVMGWNINTPSQLSILYGQGAVDEPQVISGGGTTIYRNISGNNVGDYFNTAGPGFNGHLWTYGSTLAAQAPGYADSYYSGYLFGNANGIYSCIGIQNPIIPYNNRLYVHRGNSIIAYGTGASRGRLPLLRMNSVVDSIVTPTDAELQGLLEAEVQKIIQAGHLRPGYYNTGTFSFFELSDYFDNPGDTLYTLSRAYPYLSDGLKIQTQNYLWSEFQLYFDPVMYSISGWANGAPREEMPLPPDIIPTLSDDFAAQRPGPRFSWYYPQHNFYAMWKYALIFPHDALRIYELAKSKIQAPVPPMATNQYLSEKTWEHNAYIAGYIGFLELQQLAGMETLDSQLRQTVTNELNRLLNLRVSNFNKDSPWTGDTSTRWHLSVARNFINLVPELGSYMRTHLYNQVDGAISEYDTIAPYWFVSRYEAVPDEGVMSALYNYHSLFQAKAYILGESRGQLTKYLDVPAFERGDLLYIQNLIAAIEAQP